MARGAVIRLDELLSQDLSLLELGSGRSTRWYADRVASVVSIEPASEWAAIVSDQLAGRKNVEVRVMSVRDYFRDPNDEIYDVVVIDHLDEPHWTRGDSLQRATQFAKLIVLDDSDRTEYQGAMLLVSGWDKKHYWSLRSTPMAITETTLLSRSTNT
jgi:hypothetical protein